jgi:hypothetical protein
MKPLAALHSVTFKSPSKYNLACEKVQTLCMLHYSPLPFPVVSRRPVTLSNDPHLDINSCIGQIWTNLSRSIPLILNALNSNSRQMAGQTRTVARSNPSAPHLLNLPPETLVQPFTAWSYLLSSLGIKPLTPSISFWLRKSPAPVHLVGQRSARAGAESGRGYYT